MSKKNSRTSQRKKYDFALRDSEQRQKRAEIVRVRRLENQEKSAVEKEMEMRRKMKARKPKVAPVIGSAVK